ncbi:MAG TPA: hypothetical protein VGR57_00595 [Ktedonobacterales bacterium]|nr:hypothetical protein [Ktedonobacterales bacterium]
MRVTVRSPRARLGGALALVALLALAGCGARVPQNGGAPSGVASGAQTAGQDASIQDVQSASLGADGFAATLTAAQADASFDYASLENETQP